MNKYKVGDKVVMEITDKISVMGEPWYVLSEATSIFETYLDKDAEPLGTYTEPLEAKIHRQAAEITRLLAENKELKAKKEFEESKTINSNMWRLAGQNEAWELARNIIIPPWKGGMSSDDYTAIFGSCISESYVMKNYTYSEAAAKVAEWERAKEEIKVGDVVSHEEKYGVVISEGTICFRGFTDDGTPFEWYKERCTKTGRHIDIGSFLKQIGDEDE